MKFLLLITTLLSQISHASDSTDKTWLKALKDNDIQAVADQAYCYSDTNGDTVGKNIEMRVKLASVSKLITSLWAVETLGAHYRYETKLFIKGKTLHIAGSFDPFFGNEKVFYLLSQLNELGYNDFDKITFDKNLLVYPSAQTHTDIYPAINPANVKKYLLNYFNTNTWSWYNEEYTRIASLSKKGKFLDKVVFKTTAVEFSETNPLENDTEAKMLTYTSPELAKYLKEINIQSNNYAAHTIFLQLGGETKFAEYITNTYGLTENKIHFYTGSGLPTVVNGNRKDNYSTCGVTLELLTELKKLVEKDNLTIEDIVAVPGSDGGTFRNRTFSSDLKNSFVAKTGTLTSVSTLAGMMSTKSGYSFFGIFNQTPSVFDSKKTQNIMVEAIMKDLGGPSAFDYQYGGFHAYDRNETIKSLLLDYSSVSDFAPFENSLN